MGNFNFSKGYIGFFVYMVLEWFYGKFFVVFDIYVVGILLYEFIVGDCLFLGFFKVL